MQDTWNPKPAARAASGHPPCRGCAGWPDCAQCPPNDEQAARHQTTPKTRHNATGRADAPAVCRCPARFSDAALNAHLIFLSRKCMSFGNNNLGEKILDKTISSVQS
jgi:hypothetical protein